MSKIMLDNIYQEKHIETGFCKQVHGQGLAVCWTSVAHVLRFNVYSPVHAALTAREAKLFQLHQWELLPSVSGLALPMEISKAETKLGWGLYLPSILPDRCHACVPKVGATAPNICLFPRSSLSLASSLFHQA